MKLSEAIREGAKLRPQTRTGFFFDEGCSCALGAAGEGAGLDPLTDIKAISTSEFLGKLWQLFPILEDGTITKTIIYKNDYGGYTREEIADWLEGQGL